MNNTIIISLVLLFCSMILTGCGAKSVSNHAVHARSYETRHPITLSQEETILEFPIEENQLEIPQIQMAKIKGFLYKYSQFSKKDLIITVPEAGVNAYAARTMVENILEVTKKVGLNENNIRIGTYVPINDNIATLRMSFETLKAKASSCEDSWSENIADAYHNAPYKGHGCATRNNLAAMIVRPEDLVQMPNIAPGRGDRRAVIFDKYVLGEITNAAKGETASATAQ